MNFGSNFNAGSMQPQIQYYTDQNDFEIQHPFSDSVTCIKFAPTNLALY